MGGRDDDSTARQMPAHHCGEHVLSGRIERGGRFVEQPDRARYRDQAGERQAPPLPGRKIGGRQFAQFLQSDGSQWCRKGPRPPGTGTKRRDSP